jgi:hypothetical protein
VFDGLVTALCVRRILKREPKDRSSSRRSLSIGRASPASTTLSRMQESNWVAASRRSSLVDQQHRTQQSVLKMHGLPFAQSFESGPLM